MKVKETIAFLGEMDRACSNFAQKLIDAGYPVLLVTKEGNCSNKLNNKLIDENPQADIETIACEKEGCWEADIIVLSNLIELNNHLLQKIKVVANQKVILYFLSKETPLSFYEGIQSFQKMLPNAHWSKILMRNSGLEFSGEKSVFQIVDSVFKQINYTVKVK